MGGGPLMDLFELTYINTAFKYAKKLNKKTIIFGCGFGPLNKKSYQKVVRSIFELSDIIIFRDKTSERLSQKVYGNNFYNKMITICDPALFSIKKYANNHKVQKHKNKITVNFRNVTAEYNEQNHIDLFKGILSWASKNYDLVELVPMHTFSIGGDDRELFAYLCIETNYHNVIPLYKPLNLYETYRIFAESSACIGMRYHSIVIQTILNGNNFILEYTNKKFGKITGFLEEIQAVDYYTTNRLINITTPFFSNVSDKLDILKINNKFEIENDIYDTYLNKYITVLKAILEEK